MSHSPFPWSEGESFVFDASGNIICREPNHPENGKNWRDDRALIAAIPEMAAALANVRKIIAEAALTGFNCHDGDWAERLFASQHDTSAVLKRVRP